MAEKIFPDDMTVRSVCKIGQGALCCRYLTMAPGGWSCEKLHPDGKMILDARVAMNSMNAQGDNCEGMDSR